MMVVAERRQTKSHGPSCPRAVRECELFFMGQGATSLAGPFCLAVRKRLKPALTRLRGKNDG